MTSSSGKLFAGVLCAFCLFLSFSPQAFAALTPLNDNTDFVKQVYRDFLNREADAGGLAYWIGKLEAGTKTRAQVVESYLNSAEFGQTIAPVARLYFAYFNRIPDYSGLMYWVGRYGNGTQLATVSNAFAGSPEFETTYGSLSNSEFVALVYQNVLGRFADANGLAYWAGQLDSGAKTRGQVMVGFSESAEYKSQMYEEIYVTMTYIGLLRRKPDTGGFNYWVTRMDSGASGLGLINSFLNSGEYAGRFDLSGYLEAAFTAWSKAELNDPITGESDMDTNNFLAAIRNFLAAKDLVGVDANASASEVEQARFFGALAGLAEMADPYSDMTDNGLGDLGDFLDAFGIDMNSRQTFNTIHIEDCTFDQVAFEEVCTIVPLDPDSPTSGEVLNALRTNMTLSLQEVIDDLDQVSTSFNCRRILGGDITETELDYADVLFIKGIAQAMIAKLDILMAYDLDVDIDNENELANDADWSNDGHDAFLSRNPDLGTLNIGYAGYLNSARSRLFLAVDAITAAMESVDREIGGDYENPLDIQGDDFISFYEESCSMDITYTYYTCSYDAVKTRMAVDETLKDLSDFETALTSAITYDNGTPYDPLDDYSVNFFKIFSGIDIREQLPNYNPTTDQFGMFPDATLGGVLDPAQLNINEDLDSDGAPDVLYGYTRFFEELLFPGNATQSQTYSSFYWGNRYADEQFVFSDDGTLSYSWSMYDYVTSTQSSLALTQGTWTIDAVSGDLTIEFAAPVASWRDAGLMDTIRINLIMGGEDSALDVEEDHLLEGVPVMFGAVPGTWWLYTALP